MKKTLITILIIVILAGLGYFAYSKGLINLEFLKKGEVTEPVAVVENKKENIGEIKNVSPKEETIQLLDTIDDNGQSIFKLFKVKPWIAKSINEYQYVYEFNFSDERARIIIKVDNGKPYAEIENGQWSADGFSAVSSVENLTNVRIEGNKFYSNKINGEFIYVDQTYRSGGSYKMYFLKIYDAWKGEFLNETYDSQTKGPILGHSICSVEDCYDNNQ